jgi:hypothetical protein
VSGGGVVGYGGGPGDHRCMPSRPDNYHLPIGGMCADQPMPPREPGPGGQQQRERESVTLTRPKGGDGKR